MEEEEDYTRPPYTRMTLDDEYQYLLKLTKCALAKGESPNYSCPYCGMPLVPQYEDEQDEENENASILCPCCGQKGAF